MKIYRFTKRQLLPITVEKAWDFLSDPRNLKLITPEYMGFQILNEEETELYAGQIIQYIVTPVLGIPTKWVTEITQVKCGYPAPVEDYNLKTLVNMQQRFGLVTGLSDHTIDNTTSIVSVGLGASIIEKHVTLDRNAGGPDDSFSLESGELKSLCEKAKIAWSSVGHVDYGRKSSEIGNAQFRRSLYVAESLSCGDVLTERNIKSIRPGYGLAPKYMTEIIGKKINKNMAVGDSLQSHNIEGFQIKDTSAE